MAGIYIHIPFCKQACHYCDFHFSTSLKYRNAMVLALVEELKMRAGEITEQVDTIYFGGGTPSILDNSEIELLLQTVETYYQIAANPEITLEANPDDLRGNRTMELANSPVNRLSIGVQSFFESDLRLMNRAHDSVEAEQCLATAVHYFDNISIDLIYGMPGMRIHEWQSNVSKALSFGVPHISSYALTVEPQTALAKMVAQGKVVMPDDEAVHQHFTVLTEMLAEAGYVHYELSNFGKPGYFSRNNTAYWQGKKYLGIGPSAHSFDGERRSWNISNNKLYLDAISSGRLCSETEVLSMHDRYNEYVMTGLRTMWGVDLQKVEDDFGPDILKHLRRAAQKHLSNGHLILESGTLKATAAGKFLTDGIASDLFLVHLDTD